MKTKESKENSSNEKDNSMYLVIEAIKDDIYDLPKNEQIKYLSDLLSSYRDITHATTCLLNEVKGNP